MKVFDLLEVVDKICPFEDAFDGDKVGLLIGSGTNDVSGIVVSHDLEKSTLDYCKENNINTVISYHPATYKKFDDLNEDLMLSKLSLEYYKENINVISIHTAQDVCIGGNGDTLTKIFNLTDVQIFGETSPGKGVGKIGSIKNHDANSLSALVENELSTKIVRTNSHYHKLNNIEKIAFVPGSGTQFLDEILGKTDVFITGDAAHHHFLLTDEYDMGFIQLNHISTEKPGMKSFTDKLGKLLEMNIVYLYNKYYE